MARPASGAVRTRGNRVLASVPRPIGERGRIERSFPDEATAQRWVDDCLAARQDARPYPDAAAYQQVLAPTVPLARASRSFGEVAWAWWREVYVEDRRTLPGRREAVEAMLRRRIVPFFDAQVTRIDQLQRDHVRAFARTLAGRDQPTSTGTTRRLTVVTDEMLSLVEAAQRCGVSPSTMRRHFMDGAFPNAVRINKKGTIRIPLGDLVAAGMLNRTGTRDTRSMDRALARSSSSSYLAVVRQIVAYAMANQEMDFDPTQGVRALPPNPDRTPHRPTKSKKTVFEYPVCAKVAGHLHIHHVVAFWIQRVLGLRVGEVFGLHVDDIGDFGDIGLLHISRQGGSKLLEYDEYGNIVAADEVQRGKTDTATRAVAIPLPLLELLRIYIAAFHTDPDTGEVDYDTRLILGLRQPGAGGVSAYRTALKKAFAAEGLTYDELGFSASTHHLRASLGGELKHQLAVDEMIRSEILGHLVRAQDGGATVTARSYTPALPQLEPFIAVAKVQGPFIVDLIGSLFHPIAQPHPLGTIGYLDGRRRATAHSILEAAGLIRTDPDLVTFAEALRIAGVSRSVLRRAMQRGLVETVTTDHPVGGRRDWYPVASVVAFRTSHRADDGWISTEQAAQQLAISQWSLVRLAKLGLITTKRLANNRYAVDAADVERRRDHLIAIAALQERAVRVAEAAATLDLSTSAVKRLAEAGKLEYDPESSLDTSVALYVTRATIERYQADVRARAEKVRSLTSLPDDWLALEDVIAATGRNRVELLDYSGKGLIIKRDATYKFFVHWESPMLESLLAGPESPTIPDTDDERRPDAEI